MKRPEQKDDTSQIYTDFNALFNEVSQSHHDNDEMIAKYENIKRLLDLKKKEEKGQAIFLFVIIFIMLVCGFFVGMYSKKYENIKWDRDQLRKIIEVKEDSLNNKYITYLVDSAGEVVTYEDLVEFRKMYYEEAIRHNEKAIEYNKSIIDNILTKDSLDHLKRVLRLSKRAYHLDYSITYNSDSTESTVSIYSPVLDSALMLLPFYREKLRYDEKRRTWVISKTVRE